MSYGRGWMSAAVVEAESIAGAMAGSEHAPRLLALAEAIRAHAPKPRKPPERRNWSLKREALLRELWPQPIHNADVRARINALPGRPISIKAIQQRACILGLKRPPKTETPHRPMPNTPYTPERVALMHRIWPIASMRPAERLARINALAGPPIRSIRTLNAKAEDLGLRRPLNTPRGKIGKVKPVVSVLPVEESSDIAAASVDRAHDLARTMLGRGVPPTSVASGTGLPLHVVFRLRSELREAA